MRHSPKAVRRPSRRKPAQAGFVMLETLVAISILGSAVMAAVASVSTAARITQFIAVAANAEWIAESQVDFIRAAAFIPTPGVYASVDAPDGYVVGNTTADSVGGDANIQDVTVTVQRNGETEVTITFIKVNR